MNAGGILTAAAPSAVAPVIALVGNPNCGKTALFNALTGSRQKVANYPGVTVEKKIGRLTTPAGRGAADRRPARHLFAARPLARRGDHARRRAGPAAEGRQSRSHRLRRRRLQPQAGAAPGARAQAGRPAGHAVAQHDGHRAQARRRDRPRAPVARARRAGRAIGRGAPRRDRRAAGRDRPTARGSAAGAGGRLARARRRRAARRPA